MAGLPANTGNKYPVLLSGGVAKCTALARVPALDPDILFLDEPTTGFDPIGMAVFDNLVRALHDILDSTIPLITHDLGILHTICDRVIVLSQKKVLVTNILGRIAAIGNTWIREYFRGPHRRTAHQAAAVSRNH